MHSFEFLSLVSLSFVLYFDFLISIDDNDRRNIIIQNHLFQLDIKMNECALVVKGFFSKGNTRIIFVSVLTYCFCVCCCCFICCYFCLFICVFVGTKNWKRVCKSPTGHSNRLNHGGSSSRSLGSIMRPNWKPLSELAHPWVWWSKKIPVQCPLGTWQKPWISK